MNIKAIALPLLIAAAFTLPAQARDINASSVSGNFVLSISSQNQLGRGFVAPRAERRGHKHGNKRYNRLSPKKIARILRHRGFYNIRKMRSDGRTYTLKANGRRGNTVRLMVSARTGEILRRKIIRRNNRWNNRWDNRWDNRGNYSGWTQSNNRQPFWMY